MVNGARKLRKATHTKKVAVEVGIVLVIIVEFAFVPVDRQQVASTLVGEVAQAVWERDERDLQKWCS